MLGGELDDEVVEPRLEVCDEVGELEELVPRVLVLLCQEDDLPMPEVPG